MNFICISNLSLLKSLGELAHEADLFANAKGGVPLCISKGQHESKRVDQVQPKVEPKQDQRPETLL